MEILYGHDSHMVELCIKFQIKYAGGYQLHVFGTKTERIQISRPFEAVTRLFSFDRFWFSIINIHILFVSDCKPFVLLTAKITVNSYW